MPASGTNWVARRLPIVIVPVLSRSNVSISPASSTALPLLAMMLAMSARSMPAMPMAASKAPMVVGIRQTSRAISVGMSSVKSKYRAIGYSAAVTIRKMSEKAASTIVERDLIGSLLPDGSLDQGDHPIEKALAGLGRDLDDDPVGKHPRASRHARAIAAGLSNDRRALAGDRALIDRGHAVDNLAIGRNHLAGLDRNEITGPQLGGRNELA